MRHVAEGNGPAPEAEELPPAVAPRLRRDGEPIPVLWAEEPEVGRPWTLQVDVRGDGIPTIRRTTFVGQVVLDPSLLMRDQPVLFRIRLMRKNTRAERAQPWLKALGVP